MRKFFHYLKKRGFTLVEALVVTIIAGYCILPVVGTLQSGLLQTAKFDHREKLRVLARSRLTKELSAGAFDHTAINTGPTYHFMYYDTANPPNLLATDSPLASPSFMTDIASLPMDKLLYSYKVSLAVKENLKLATTSVNIDKNLLLDLKGLKALFVMAELEDGPNVLATDSISYFAMLNIPSFSDDYIWIANAKNVEIIAVDPESKSAVQNILLPLNDTTKGRDKNQNDKARPWNLAVHPNKKFIAYQQKRSIAALNIDKEDSANYGKVKQLYPYPSGDAVYDFVEGSTDEKDKTLKDLGLVFRPDGKYCFVTAHGNKNLYAFKLQNLNDWNTLQLELPATIYTATTHEFSALHAGNDGYLYLGLRNQKKAVRFPMFANNYNSLPEQEIADTVTAGKLLSVQTSPDGQQIYTLQAKEGSNDPYLAQYSSKSLKKTGSWRFAVKGDASDMKISGDGRFIGIVDEFDAKNTATNEGGLYVIDLRAYPLTTPTTSPDIAATLSIARAARPAIGSSKKNRDRNDAVLFEYFTNEFFFDDKEKPLLFGVDAIGVLANSYSTSIPESRIVEFATDKKQMVAMNSRKPEYVLVGSTDNKINFVDINTNQIKESKQITLPHPPINLALSPLGEKVKAIYGSSRAGVDTFDTQIATLTHGSHGGSNMFGIIIPNEGYHANASHTMFATMERHDSIMGYNGYWADIPTPGTLPPAWRTCADIDFAVEWQAKDIVALNNGGFLILFAKSDGSALLEWVGKHQWGTNVGKYERFARWFSSADNFPPQYSQYLAVSPDDKFLAIGTSEATNPNKIYLYDFATNNFGHETQLPGWVVDYRTGADTQPIWTFGTPPGGCIFTVQSPSLTTGIKLQDSITSRDNWIGYNNFPGNFANTSVAGTNLLAKRDSNRRFFGYFMPETDVKRFAIHNWDHTRWFYDYNFAGQRTETGSAGNLPPFDVLQKANTRSHIQIDFNTGGNVKQGIFTHLTAGQALGAITDSAEAAQAKTINMAGWAKIPSLSTMPFKFQPTYLTNYSLTTCINNNIGALTWSRDQANPILYYIDTINDDIWALKPGKPITRIVNNLSFDTCDRQLVVSNDGSKLIYATEDVPYQLHFVDIANPTDSFFTGGAVAIPASNYGSLQIATLSAQPKSLATLPFNSIKSSPASGTIESVATLSVNISGLHTAVLASGGIYILGGSATEKGAAGGSADIDGGPSNKIFRFDPTLSYGSPISPVVATLTKPIKMNSIAAYDDKIYIFNGNINTTGSGNTPTTWVQKYDPLTGKVWSSYDPPPVVSTEIRVSNVMTAYNKINGEDTPTRVTHTGLVYSNYEGWKAFDDIKTTYGKQWSPTAQNQTLTYDFGKPQLKLPINKIIISNYDANASSDALHNFEFYGDTAPLLTGVTSSYNNTEPFDVPNFNSYQTYKLKAISKKDGGSVNGFTVSELELYIKGVRRISPDIGMTGYTQGSFKVTDSAHDSGEEGWRVFDGQVDDGNKWDTDTSSGYPHWVALDLGAPDNVDIVRIHCQYDDHGIKNFSFEGSDDGSTWTTLQIQGLDVIENPDNTAWNTYHVTNTNYYRHYRLKCISAWGGGDLEVWEVEYFSTMPPYRIHDPEEMTKTKDDTGVSFAFQEGAACATPYGIVLAGGSPNGTTATVKAMVYWPHGIDSYELDNPPSPIAWYELDETSGIIANSSRGYNHGTVTNPVWAQGKIKNGLQLNGANTMLSAVRPVQDDFTIACWIKTASIGNGEDHFETSAIVHSELSGVNNDFGFGIDSNGKLAYGDGRLSLTDITVRTVASINNNTWRHVAVTRVKSTGKVKLYIDGSLAYSGTCNVGNSLNALTHFNTGYANDAGANKYLNGMIDDLKFYDTALSDSSINRIMMGDLYSKGIFRSIPTLPGPIMYHSLVWHKGRLYRIGGKSAAATTPANIDIFDFSNNQWTQITFGDTNYFATGAEGALIHRYKASACSFGDEIFVFGGFGSDSVVRDYVAAWNPDTKRVRRLATIPGGNYAKSAVPCGSSIYLIGGSTNSTNGGTSSILKFTP